jgi:hypothetical protein
MDEQEIIDRLKRIEKTLGEVRSNSVNDGCGFIMMFMMILVIFVRGCN